MITTTATLPGLSVAPDYRRAVEALHVRFGIPGDYGTQRHLSLQQEARELVNIGVDTVGRAQQLTPPAAEAWQRMRAAAAEDGVQLLVVSAFRSVEYQCALIQRKLDRGLSIEQILKINAAPGYSEHHTGCALDLTAADCPPLEEGFEGTAAFRWLSRHAGDHGFHLSYPRDNPHGINYEPWHWAYKGS